MKDVKIFEAGRKYGNMNTAERFYPEGMTVEGRSRSFLQKRLQLGNEYGFDGHKVAAASQLDKTGTFYILTEKDVKENPDLWKLDIAQDILVISEKYSKGIVASHPVADCPVVMAIDELNGITAVCHCSAELVDKHLPELTVEALRKATKEMGYIVPDRDNYLAYVSSCAGSNWEYNTYPKWAQDEKVWQGNITEQKNNKGIYNINIRSAVVEQLYESGLPLESIRLSKYDTITDSRFFSHSASFKDSSKAGRNLIGAFYEEEVFSKKLVK